MTTYEARINARANAMPDRWKANDAPCYVRKDIVTPPEFVVVEWVDGPLTVEKREDIRVAGEDA